MVERVGTGQRTAPPPNLKNSADRTTTEEKPLSEGLTTNTRSGIATSDTVSSRNFGSGTSSLFTSMKPRTTTTGLSSEQGKQLNDFTSSFVDSRADAFFWSAWDSVASDVEVPEGAVATFDFKSRIDGIAGSFKTRMAGDKDMKAAFGAQPQTAQAATNARRAMEQTIKSQEEQLKSEIEDLVIRIKEEIAVKKELDDVKTMKKGTDDAVSVSEQQASEGIAMTEEDKVKLGLDDDGISKAPGARTAEGEEIRRRII